MRTRGAVGWGGEGLLERSASVEEGVGGGGGEEVQANRKTRLMHVSNEQRWSKGI